MRAGTRDHVREKEYTENKEPDQNLTVQTRLHANTCGLIGSFTDLVERVQTVRAYSNGLREDR